VPAFLIGALAGYGIAIPVGAIAVLIIETGIRRGLVMAAAAGAGAASADLVFSALAVVGGSALAEWIGSFDDILGPVSAGLLAVIALVGLSRAWKDDHVDAPRRDRSGAAATYLRFLGLTLINPSTVVYFAAVVVGLGVASDLGGGEAALFVTGAFLASLSWQLGLAAVGSYAGHRLGTRSRRAAAIAGNLIILGFAVAIALR
jgi:arginine exporter protein ArgO